MGVGEFCGVKVGVVLGEKFAFSKVCFNFNSCGRDFGLCARLAAARD